MFVGEKLLEQYLTQGLNDIANQTALAGSVLSSLSLAEQEEAVQWLNESLQKKTVSITQGYPRRAPTTPLITIVVGGEAETDQPIGMFGEVFPQDSTTFVQWEGAWFQTSYRLLIMSDNADTVTRLSAFVKFTLLRYRAQLTADGLYEQAIGMSDLLPAEEFSNPQMQVFQRGLTLSGKHFAEYPAAIGLPMTTLTTVPTFSAYGVDITETNTIPVP